MNHLDQLESESIYILREAFNRIEKLAMLRSLGKDSNTMVWLAKKAFFGHVPFPVVHVDTGKKFPEMYAFSSRYAAQWNLNLIVRPCPPVEEVDATLPPAARSAYVGVMGRQEGIDLLLQAVRHLVHKLKRTDIHFGLVGDGTSLREMQNLARELGVADYVTFTGRVPDAELLAMLNTADVCVNPDVANEMNDISTMNKIMEYMALGKPMVQFDLTEGRFSAQEASLYAKKNDPVHFAVKIADLLDNPEQRARMGAFGRRRVQDELEWRYEAPKLLSAYDALWAKTQQRQQPAT
jgi:glycosyltransferase involved in cell wall biosynthesis